MGDAQREVRLDDRTIARIEFDGGYYLDVAVCGGELLLRGPEGLRVAFEAEERHLLRLYLKNARGQPLRLRRTSPSSKRSRKKGW